MGLFGPKKPKRDQLQEHYAATGEVELVRASDWVHNGDVVVTDRRSMFVRKGVIEKNIEHRDVAQTSIMEANNFMIVLIETHTALRDFMPNDHRRYGFMIQAHVKTPGIAQDICREIDRRLGPVMR